MAQPRKKPTAWQRRNARARKLGYRNYYDYRAHDYGKRPPGEEQPTGEEAKRLRGHAGPVALRRALRKPDRIALIVEIPEIDRHGQWAQMRYVGTFTNGDIREYVVPIHEESDIEMWRDEIDASGVEFIEYASKAGGAASAAA